MTSDYLYPDILQPTTIPTTIKLLIITLEILRHKARSIHCLQAVPYLAVSYLILLLLLCSMEQVRIPLKKIIIDGLRYDQLVFSFPSSS